MRPSDSFSSSLYLSLSLALSFSLALSVSLYLSPSLFVSRFVSLSLHYTHTQTDTSILSLCVSLTYIHGYTHFLCQPVTSWAVSGDALPDDELSLPEHGPDKVPWTTADLHHLPRQRHLLPAIPLWAVVVDTLTKPHLMTQIKQSVNQMT